MDVFHVSIYIYIVIIILLLRKKSASDEWGRVSLLQQQNKKTCKVQMTKRKVDNISEIYISL